MKTTIASAIEAKAVVRVLTENPYREGTKAWKRFNAYKNGKLVESTLESKKVDREGFRWDVNTKVIALEAPKRSKKATAH